MSIKSVKIENLGARITLFAMLLLCLTGAVFFAKWCLGSTIALQSAYKEVAELAVSLAPSDPQTHYSVAVLNDKSLLMEDLPKSIAAYEQATALSPNDFRLWLALGRARERGGDAAGAEKALRRALELAPNYAEVQWTLGNVLLRQGKAPEAFAEIRKAVQADAKYTGSAVSMAWQIFEGDLAEVRRYLGESTPLNAALAVFLAKEKRFDEAARIWNAVPEDERQNAFRQNGEDLFRELLTAKKYRAALEVGRQTGKATSNQAVGKMTNAGFEEELRAANQNPFDWQIAEGAQPQIGPNNTEKHGGNLSLLFIYNSSDGKDLRPVSQIVAVEAGKKYSFETFYKSDLKTSATLKWEIVDAASGNVLAATGAVVASADWTALKTDFVPPENAEGVIVRLVRDGCKSAICPIVGKVWFDDFVISER